MFPTPHICHRGPADPGRSSAAFSSAAAVADSSPHRKSAIQDLQVLTGAQQRLIVLEQWQIILHTAHLPPSTCRSWQELRSTGAVADCSPHPASAIQDLQILAGAQQRWSCGSLFPTPQICHPGPVGSGRSSAVLELWQLVPHTTHLPSRTCRSWEELSSAETVADCSPHPTSAIEDLQILAGAQQHSAALQLWQILPHTASLPSRTCRS